VQAHDTASFDLLHQTLKVTSLGTLKVGSVVNLERALLPTQRLGGHFVQGHVDGTGTLLDLSVHGQDHRLEISLPPEIHKYCIDKGSIAIDGISLTIAELKDGSVGVPPASTPAEAQAHASAVFWITPHTFQETHLHSLEIGHTINLEADLLAKYTEKLLAKRG
jgi:riboflavin synthase